MPAKPKTQGQRFHDALSRLVRGYQYRDREQAGSYGISVSDWYPLELIESEGPLVMGKLAARLSLELSTATRVIDRLVASGWVERTDDPRDRRRCLVHATRSGRQKVGNVRSRLTQEFSAVLADVDRGAREQVVRAMELLLESFEARREREETM